MAEVTGSIGDQPVELNNAASEITLKALLSVAKLDSEILKRLALKFKVDLDKLQEEVDANAEAMADNTLQQISYQQSLDKSIEKWTRLNLVADQLNATMFKLAEGTYKSSDLFDSFGKMDNALGAVIRTLGPLVKMQEENFAAYQKISSAGVTFAGSLTDLRLAAANSFLTLDQFSNLMKTNGAQFLQLGGSVNDGAMAFSRFSGSIMNSKMGSHLMALGYSAEEANSSLLNYLAVSGVSNTKDLETNKQLREGAGEYLEELDRLAQVTGKSREEQEQNMKKLQVDAQVQMTAARMPAEQRAIFLKNVEYMTSQYGDAGKDIALAQAQHRSVMTKEGAMLVATSKDITKNYDQMAKDSYKYGLTSQQRIDGMNKISLGVQQGFNNFPLASIGTGIKGIDTAIVTTAKQMQQGLTSEKAFNERDQKIKEDRLKREDSQAKQMADTDQAFKKLGAELLKGFTPVIKHLTDFTHWLGQGALKIANFLEKNQGAATALAGLITVVTALTAIQAARVIKEKSDMLLGGAGRLLGGRGGGGGGGGGAAGEVLANVGKAGPGIGATLTGLAEGLSALGAAAGPVLIGAGVLAGVIAILGAGVAVAMYAISKSLPSLAAGFTAFNEVDGGNLLKVSLGIGALGIAMVGLGAGLTVLTAGNILSSIASIFTPGKSGLGGFIENLNNSLSGFDVVKLTGFATGLEKLSSAMVTYGKAVSSIDIAKAERVKELMKGTSAAEQIANAGSKAFTAAADRITTAIAGPTPGGTEKSSSDMIALNNTMKEILKYIRATADNTETSARALKPSWIPKGVI